MVDGAIFDNLKHILMDAMVFFGDLDEDNMASRLITCRVDGVSIFQGVKIGVIVQLKYQKCTIHD